MACRIAYPPYFGQQLRGLHFVGAQVGLHCGAQVGWHDGRQLAFG
jgi:hypothetical protein